MILDRIYFYLLTYFMSAKILSLKLLYLAGETFIFLEHLILPGEKSRTPLLCNV